MINHKKNYNEIIALAVTVIAVGLIYFIDKYAPHFASFVHFASITTVLARTLIIFLFAFRFGFYGKKYSSKIILKTNILQYKTNSIRVLLTPFIPTIQQH